MHEAFKKTFGEVCEYEPLSGGSFSISGIFNDRHVFVDPNTEQVVSTIQPTLGVKLADMPAAPVKGDKVTLRNVQYVVRDSREDGEGWLHLFMYEV
jgi:hypothetical protein